MKAIKVIAWVLISFILLLLAIALFVQIPAVQLKIAKYATTWITDKTHGRVEIKDFRIKFPKTIVISGLYMEDLTKDTLAYVGMLKIDLAFSALLHQKVQIHSLNLEDAVVKINRAEKDSLFNYEYLITAFSSESPTPKKPSFSSRIRSCFKPSRLFRNAGLMKALSNVNSPITSGLARLPPTLK